MLFQLNTARFKLKKNLRVALQMTRLLFSITWALKPQTSNQPFCLAQKTTLNPLPFLHYIKKVYLEQKPFHLVSFFIEHNSEEGVEHPVFACCTNVKKNFLRLDKLHTISPWAARANAHVTTNFTFAEIIIHSMIGKVEWCEHKNSSASWTKRGLHFNKSALESDTKQKNYM